MWFKITGFYHEEAMIIESTDIVILTDILGGFAIYSSDENTSQFSVSKNYPHEN